MRWVRIVWCLLYLHSQKVHTFINMFSNMYFYTFISYAENTGINFFVFINAYMAGAYS
jgi:hypothetical protein